MMTTRRMVWASRIVGVLLLLAIAWSINYYLHGYSVQAAKDPAPTVTVYATPSASPKSPVPVPTTVVRVVVLPEDGTPGNPGSRVVVVVPAPQKTTQPAPSPTAKPSPSRSPTPKPSPSRTCRVPLPVIGCP